MPVIGLEAEFEVFVDESLVVPEDYWRTPSAFMDRPLLRRTSKSLQLPTGGALYFDGGVIEVVTPVIEIAPQCTGRVVRSLWEQIGFVREQLNGWEKQAGRSVRLRAFSCHFNISFELARAERNRNRTIQKLAVLLAHVLPVPVIVLGANRQSTGMGVRPRRDRVEITFDFTPDPGLMAATTALIVGVVREVIGWPSYLLGEAESRGIPMLSGLEPGKHATRKGWLAQAKHFPRDPFGSDINAPDWLTNGGQSLSLRKIALQVALEFRESIRRHADPFSVRVLFSVLRGETPALLDLKERPGAYDDVGRSTRWGSVLPELRNFASLMNDSESLPARQQRRRRADVEEKLAPPWRGAMADRRLSSTRNVGPDRRADERQRGRGAAPSLTLTRSAYEGVFLNLGGGKRLRLGSEVLVPVSVKGWYHSVFRSSNGEERLISIDQLLHCQGTWVD